MATSQREPVRARLVNRLTAAGRQAGLTGAMGASIVVTKPSDVKPLIDAAAHALRLVETTKSNQIGKPRLRSRVSWIR
jgi:hypothetical protein